MPAFVMTSPTDTVEIGPAGVGRVTLTVKNVTGRPILARADLVGPDLQPLDATLAGSLSIDGKREREFDDGASEAYDIVVTATGAPPGRHTFRVVVVATSESASEFSAASEPFAFEIPAAPKVIEIEPPPPKDPWRYVAIGLAVLVVIMAIVAIALLVTG